MLMLNITIPSNCDEKNVQLSKAKYCCQPSSVLYTILSNRFPFLCQLQSSAFACRMRNHLGCLQIRPLFISVTFLFSRQLNPHGCPLWCVSQIALHLGEIVDVTYYCVVVTAPDACSLHFFLFAYFGSRICCGFLYVSAHSACFFYRFVCVCQSLIITIQKFLMEKNESQVYPRRFVVAQNGFQL